jgi:hypothetical protein
MNDLAELIEEIKKTKPLADENLETGHYTTLNARRGRQARAIETMKELTEKYSQKLLQGTVFILTAGALKDEFTAMATEKYQYFSADPEVFYKDLLKQIHPNLYTSGPSNIFDVLGRILENKMLELGVLEYPQPQFKNAYQRGIKGEADVLQLVKDIINDQVGGEIAGVAAVRSLVPAAIKQGHNKRVTPLILNTSDEKLTLSLTKALTEITPFVFLVVAGKASKAFKLPGAVTIKDVTVESVEAALKTIGDSVKRV